MKNLLATFILSLFCVLGVQAETYTLHAPETRQIGTDTINCVGGGQRLTKICTCSSEGCNQLSGPAQILTIQLIDSNGRVVHESCSIMDGAAACSQAAAMCN